MKKLLTILGSTTLLVIPTISVLSCKTINAISTAEEYNPESIKDQVEKYLQKAKYKDNECVQIGYFQNKNKEIQIVPFKPTTTKVPSSLPNEITSLKEAFKGLQTSSVEGIQNWDTSKITDMTSVFDTTNEFDQDISNWDTSKVTNMNFMFTRAKKFNQNLNKWKTDKVTLMINTFQNTKEFNSNIKDWKTDAVTSMKGMFNKAVKFDQDISTWKTDKVTDMSYMFDGAEKFNKDISSWKVETVQNFNGMLRNAKEFDKELKKWTFEDEIKSDKRFEFAKGTKLENQTDKLPTWKKATAK
ncbi:DUF285 domain-containing protein [Mycoplasma mycoides subsp. capri]|uniref:BspA family leucine-rich repeat surface protein n=1 Tax=Mycoplasma mycoides TaxID=2102 RepID=UPI00223EE447|nr:BspA family leucine-rich repeat surface protein [Mycoplasma mycoides]QVK01924.1 DUF285 domain-containing protein [Mycoplasma mycoides subsp. capri]